MSWIDKFRRTKSQQSKINYADFGRFSDAYKAPSMYKAWEKSLTLFDKGKRFSAFQHFFEYLKNNDGQNVSATTNQGTLKFELIQGSQKIYGTIDSQSVNIQAILVKKRDFPESLLFELLNENYNLRFCKYALAKNGDLILAAHATIKSTSPFKLFHILKETALTADKKDDLIYDKYQLDNPTATSLHYPRPAPIKEASYQLLLSIFRKEKQTIEFGRLDTNHYPSALRYLLLASTYKIDFLTKPQGVVMEKLEEIDHIAFSGNGNDPNIINQQILAIHTELEQMPREDIKKTFYSTVATFGFNPIIQSAQIRDTIYSELPTMDWYLENEYWDYAIAIVDFIVGYLLFNFTVPPPCKALLLLYYRVRERDYFENIGYRSPSFDDRGFGNWLRKEIQTVVSSYKNEFRFLSAPTQQLEYEQPVLFYKSYLAMVAEINFTGK